jgi:predicted ester cyclase
MSTEENKAIVRRLFEELDNGNPGIFTELCTPDAKHYLTGSAEPVAPSDLVQSVTSFYEAFPDYRHSIEDVIAEGDRVVVRCVCTGTHTGDFMGMPPTGMAFEHGVIVIGHISGGKIVKAWVQEDNLWMMQQLGLELKPKAVEA